MKVAVGAGAPIDLGATESTPTIGITDYSRRVTDDFGVTTVVERGFSRRMSVRMALPFDEVDGIQRLLADLRATSALWIADDDIEWLKPSGFYKDFEVDLNVPPLSFCTLTVEGLAENAAVADAGADPAPEGSDSTLRMLLPTVMTDAVLTSSSVPENDAPVWGAGITYPLGGRVIRTGSHRIYESLGAGNIGHDPLTSPANWLDVGPTNRWAMFDEALGTVTSSGTGSIVVTFDTGPVGAVALLDVVGSTVQVEVIATGDVDPTYDQTIATDGGAIRFLDLPGIAGTVRVTIAGVGTVSVGTLLIGDLVGLGITEASPTAGITDFSRKVVDDFGEVSIVERAWAKRMSARALIRTDAVDLVANRIAAVRARPVLWIGDDGLDSLTVYGFFRDFSIEVGETVSKLSLSIEGLSKAQPLKAPWADDIDQLAQAIDRIASDGYLNAGEKLQAVIDWNAAVGNFNALEDRYLALGSPSDITPARDDANAKLNTLGVYLSGLVPAWDDTSADTPIVAATYQARWVDAYTAIAAFTAAITGRVGASALTGYLTNESHTLEASNSGAVTSYADASGTFKVLYGTTDVTLTCNFTVLSNPQGLTNGASALINATSGAYAVTGGLDAGEAGATATFRATHPVYGSIDKVFSLAKSVAGANGLTPPLLRLTADFQTFNFDTNGNIVARTITFKAARNATATGATTWTCRNSSGAAVFTGVSATGVQSTGYWTRIDDDTLTMTHTQFLAFTAGHPEREAFSMEAISTGASDKISVYKVEDGAPGANAKLLYLTSDRQVITFDTTGAAAPAAQTTNITVREQALSSTIVTVSLARADGTVINANSWLAGSGTITAAGNNFTMTGTALTLTAPNFTAAIGTGKGVIVTVTHADGVGDSLSITKSQDGGVGPNGLNAKTIYVVADRQQIVYDKNGALSPATQTTNFTANKQNTAGTVAWTIRDNKGNALAPVTSYLGAATGDTNTMTAAQFAAAIAVNGATGVIVTGAIASDGISDTWSINKTQDGADGQDGMAFSTSTPTISVAADYLGTAKASQFPITFSCKFIKGGVDLSGAATFTVPAKSNNDAAKASALIVSIGSVTAEGWIDVRCQYGGIFDQTIRIPVTIQRDQAPAQQGAAQQTTNEMGAFNSAGSTSYPAVPVYIMTVRADASGQLNFAYGYTYTIPPPATLGSRSAKCATKIVYRVAGSGGAWIDATAEVAAFAATSRRYEIAPGEPETEQTVGSGSDNQTKTGLTASGDYEVGMQLRNWGSDSVGIVQLFGSFTAKQP